MYGLSTQSCYHAKLPRSVLHVSQSLYRNRARAALSSFRFNQSIYTRQFHLPRRLQGQFHHASDHPNSDTRWSETGEAYPKFRPSLILRPTIFLITVCVGGYLGAAYLTQRHHNVNPDQAAYKRAQMGGLLGPPSQRRFSRGITDWYLRRFPHGIPDAYTATFTIIGANALVFLAWQIPPLVPFMTRHFTHQSLSGLNYTLLTSVFSHRSFFHFLINSVAFYSFGPATFSTLGRTSQLLASRSDAYDQGPPAIWSTHYYHYLAFYLAAGTTASYIPHLVNVLYRLPRTPLRDLIGDRAVAPNILHKATPPPPPTPTTTIPTNQIPLVLYPSLGASGALYAALSLTALAHPDASVSLIFFPFVPINIQTAMGGLCALDAYGILAGWRVFGHWAHLTGAAMGYFAWRGGGEGRGWRAAVGFVGGGGGKARDKRASGGWKD